MVGEEEQLVNNIEALSLFGTFESRPCCDDHSLAVTFRHVGHRLSFCARNSQ
jgi:hypothetical protein